MNTRLASIACASLLLGAAAPRLSFAQQPTPTPEIKMTITVDGESQPETAADWVQAGALAMSEKNYDKAISCFDEALKSNPDDNLKASIFNDRGSAHGFNNEPGKAFDDFDQAIRADPKLAESWCNRACAREALGQHDKAMDDFAEALRLKPELIPAWYNRGRILSGRGEYDKAIDDLSHAISLDPGNAAIRDVRGNALEHKGDLAKAIDDYTEAIRIDPAYVKSYYDRGNAFAGKGDFEKAMQDLDEMVRRAPDSPVSWLARGIVYEKQGAHDKAIADDNEAIRLDPKYIAAYISRAEAFDNKAEYQKELDDLNQALRVNPKSPLAINGLAWLMSTCPDAKFRDGKKAIDDARQACELLQWKDPSSIDTLAAAYAETGDFDNAVKYEQQALDTPGFDAANTADAKARLALYKTQKPYREEKKP